MAVVFPPGLSHYYQRLALLAQLRQQGKCFILYPATQDQLLLDPIPPQFNVVNVSLYRPVAQTVEELQYRLGLFKRLFIGIGQQWRLFETFKQLRLKPGVIVWMPGKMFQ